MYELDKFLDEHNIFNIAFSFFVILINIFMSIFCCWVFNIWGLKGEYLYLIAFAPVCCYWIVPLYLHFVVHEDWKVWIAPIIILVSLIAVYYIVYFTVIFKGFDFWNIVLLIVSVLMIISTFICFYYYDVRSYKLVLFSHFTPLILGFLIYFEYSDSNTTSYSSSYGSSSSSSRGKNIQVISTSYRMVSPDITFGSGNGTVGGRPYAHFSCGYELTITCLVDGKYYDEQFSSYGSAFTTGGYVSNTNVTASEFESDFDNYMAGVINRETRLINTGSHTFRNPR